MSWFEILRKCRKLDEFTSEELARACGFTGTDSTSPIQIASGWTGKFHAWGYLRRLGKRGRFVVWTVTALGVKKKAPSPKGRRGTRTMGVE